ncbi:hypothetical protein CR513_41960, partial [Mucuna pruriens]
MKELGKLKYFLGIKVVYSKHGIFISQRKYVLDFLKETGKLGCKTSGYLLSRTIGLGVRKVQSQRSQILPMLLVWSANLCMILGERQLHAVERIFQYLKESSGRGLLFRKEDT